jgi:hypothetical protein
MSSMSRHFAMRMNNLSGAALVAIEETVIAS